MNLATAPVKPGYRVIWIGEDGVTEIRGIVERVFKHKAVIYTKDFQKITVPIDELTIAPVRKPVPAVHPPATEPAIESPATEPVETVNSSATEPTIESPATEPFQLVNDTATELFNGSVAERQCEHKFFPAETGWVCYNCAHRTVDRSPEWKAAYIQHLEKLKTGYERDRNRHSGKRWREINSAVEELAEEIAALNGSVAESLPSIDATEPEEESIAPVPSPTSNLATEPSPDSSGWVEEYRPHGKNTVYFRYVYRGEQGHRRTLHISGGNVKAPLAKERAERVHNAIVCGMTPPEIVKIINSWRNKPK